MCSSASPLQWEQGSGRSEGRGLVGLSPPGGHSPTLPTAGLAEEGTKTYSCWRGAFQRCLVRLSAS